MAEPEQILALALEQVERNLYQSVLSGTDMIEHVEYVARNLQNRAGARCLLACLLAKVHIPEIDIRKPYVEAIGTPDSFSGRAYDETYIADFVIENELPCNPTTAFLTPGFRNLNTTLSLDLNLSGRPKRLYSSVLTLLDDVYQGRVGAADLLAETIRWLIIVRDERKSRIATLLANLQSSERDSLLSTEDIVGIISQHLSQSRSSRLPVLLIAAVYITLSDFIGERLLPLHSHTAADSQTQAIGDLEITMIDDERIVTSYEMKTRSVTRNDIDLAIQKIQNSGTTIDNYIFVTTHPIERDVEEYALTKYDALGGIEVVILDCIGFLRHILHLFHRLRTQFLENYQLLVLEEPDSGVNQSLKEVLLSLRQVAESGKNQT